LKIVILGPAFPLRGGIADFNEALASSLISEGHTVSIYSFSYQYPDFLFPGTSQFTTGPKPEHLQIFPTLNSINPLSWFTTASKIKKENPDMVIVRFWLPFMGPSLGTVAKLLRRKKIKVIAITDNVIPHEKRVGDSALTNYFIKNCDAFITMSRSVLNDLEKFTTNTKKIFLPHPIYNIFGDAVSKDDAKKFLHLNADKLILFFGFIRPYKGLSMLLDSMNDPRIKQLGIKLLVAGEYYEDKGPYLEKIKSYKLENDVIMHTDFISKEIVRYYFCAADIIVQPYLTATQSGITQIAYHFGRPMLVTNVGGLSEIVSDRRVGYVTEKNATAIADALVDYYEHNREMEFIPNVLNDREKFSWKSFIKGLMKLYEDIN
jgi:D-inositol-3-phosphate glycosyltransferase